MYDNKLRVKFKTLTFDRIEFNKIEEGLNCHFKVDKLFHNSTYFNEKSKYIADTLKEVEFTGIKRHFYFFGHILLEIFLDRLIMRMDPEIPKAFYRSMDEVDLEVLMEYFKEREYKIEEYSFSEYFNRFRERQFMYGYGSDEGMVHVFNMLHKRVFKSEVLKTDLDLLDNVLEEIDAELSKDYYSIFEEIRAAL